MGGLDHATAFLAGPAEAANLGVMRRSHCCLKQDPRWTVTQPTPGTFVWTSPGNCAYTRETVVA